MDLGDRDRFARGLVVFGYFWRLELVNTNSVKPWICAFGLTASGFFLTGD